MYEILIGGEENTKYVIRRGINGADQVTFVTQSILDPDNYVKFRITYENGVITVYKYEGETEY